MFLLFANFELQLDHRVPRWRYIVFLRLITILVSLATIACFAGVCLGKMSGPSDSTGWQWGNSFLESSTFFPVSDVRKLSDGTGTRQIDLARRLVSPLYGQLEL